MSKIIIGVDGGGTKTLAVLFSAEGEIIKKHTTGFSNFSIDETVAKLNIIEALDFFLKGMKDEEKPSIIIGVAGLAKLKNKEGFKAQLQTRYNAEVTLETDALIALYSVPGATDKEVIMAIGGTGSVVMAKDHLGVKMIGGYGHLLGDEGSAYHFVKNTFQFMIDDVELNDAPSSFTKDILKTIKAQAAHDIIEFVYNQSKSELASFSKTIAQKALEGDLTAKGLLVEEGKLAAEQIIRAYHKLAKKDDLVIALRGGFITQAPHVKETIINTLDKVIKNYTLDLSDNEPVTGAYYLWSLEKNEVI